MADVLESIIRADRVWALRHRRPEAQPEYLIHLAAALASELAMESREAQGPLVESRGQVRALVEAVTSRWNGNRSVRRQVAEALRQLGVVRAFLESLEQQSSGLVGPLELAPHRPVEGAA